jgi:polysaccharide biosynthesis transport protein
MEPSSREYDYEKYLRLVLGRKRLFAFVALIVMTAAVLYSYTLPKIYEARSTVFIEQNVVSELVKGIAVTPSMEAKISVLSVDMQSRSLLSQVIRDLDLDHQRSDSEREEFIKYLNAKTNISMDRQRGLFVITFRDQNPVLAMEFVNTLIRRYIEQSSLSNREETTEATQFLGEQIGIFRDRIGAAEERINEFRRENALILATDEVTLRREISTAEEELAAHRIRRNELEAQRNIFQSSDPLRERLAALQKRLDELLASYTEQYPEVIKIRAEIESTQNRMSIRDPEVYATVSDPQRFEQIQVELNALTRMMSNLEEQVGRNKALLREIPSVRSALNDLITEKEKQRQIYEQLVGRYGQSELSKEMELQDKSQTFRVIDPAILPTSPVSPNRVKIMLMGIIAGLGGAFSLLVLLGLLNTSVKSVDDVKTLGLPIMALIPKVRDEQEIRRTKRRDLRFYFLTGGYFGVILCFLALEFLGIGIVDRMLEEMQIMEHVSGAKDIVVHLIR